MLLNIVTVSYAGGTTASAPISGTLAGRRDHLFGLYVNQMLQRRAAERRYTPEQTFQWLSWLADQMAHHGQTVFYLERLQRDWLPQGQRQIIGVCSRLVVALVVGLVVALVVGAGLALVFASDTELVSKLSFGLVFGFVAALVVGLIPILDEDIRCVETVRWSWSRIRVSMFSSLVRGLVASLVVGPVFGLVAGLVGGLPYGLLYWLHGGLGIGLAMGLEVGLRVGLVGLVLGLVAGLTYGLVGVLSFGEIETKALPNEGIHRSARNALVLGLVVGLAVGLVVGVLFGLGWDLFIGVPLGLVAGVIGGLVVGLRAGGEACLKHLILRLGLIRNGSIPWNYVRFLDYATERILLRKVGGGYAFLHRMLLEYFAARYVEPSAPRARDDEPSPS